MLDLTRMSSNEPNRNLARKTYLFAIPKLGSSLLLGIVGFALFNLYTAGYQLDELWVGFAISMGYVSIAASQFFFGWISDRWYVPKLGRRKPYIIILTPVMAITFIMLLMPGLVLQNPSKDTLFWWLLLWDMLFEMSYAVTTPYGAWMAEQFSVKERPKVSQIMNIFGYIGNGIMVVFTFVVLSGFKDKLEANPGVTPPEYIWGCVIFTIIFFVTFYMTAFLMPVEPAPKTKPDLKKNLRNIFRNKNYLFVVLMQGMASLAWISVTTVMLSYTQTVLGFGTLQYVLAGVTLLLGIFIFLYVWRRIIAKKGKTKGLLLLFVLACAILSCSLFGLIPSSSTLVFGLLFIAGIAFVLGGWFLLSGIWYADIADDDAHRTDDMKAGLYGGFPSIVLNLFQALGTFILGVITGDAAPILAVGDQTFAWGYVFWGPISAAYLIATYFFTKRFIHLDFTWEKESKGESKEQRIN